MNRSRWPAFVFALLGATSCATLSTAPGGSSAAAPAVEDQLFKLQKDAALLIEKLDRLERGQGDRRDARPCADAAARGEVIEKRLRVLEEQLLDVQRRLDEILAEVRVQRRTDLARPTPPAAGGGAPVGGGGPTPSEPAPGGPAPGRLSPEDLFNAAYADYSRGAYDLALTGFEGALRADPDGPLADDAQYWIGETLYAQGKHLEAAAEFDKVLSQWPKGDKIVVARLKKGLALYEGKRTGEGVLELQRVINLWPGSDEARLARDFLRRKGVFAE